MGLRQTGCRFRQVTDAWQQHIHSCSKGHSLKSLSLVLLIRTICLLWAALVSAMMQEVHIQPCERFIQPEWIDMSVF